MGARERYESTASARRFETARFVIVDTDYSVSTI